MNARSSAAARAPAAELLGDIAARRACLAAPMMPTPRHAAIDGDTERAHVDMRRRSHFQPADDAPPLSKRGYAGSDIIGFVGIRRLASSLGQDVAVTMMPSHVGRSLGFAALSRRWRPRRFGGVDIARRQAAAPMARRRGSILDAGACGRSGALKSLAMLSDAGR